MDEWGWVCGIVPPGRGEAFCRDRVHGSSSIVKSGAVSSHMDSRRSEPGLLHRLVLPPERLQQVGRAGIPVGPALRGEIRQRAGGVLVLGGVERTGYLLLARDAGR